MLFFGYIVPLLDALIKVIVTWLEYPKQLCAEKITQSEARIKALSEDSSPVIQKIGFIVEEKPQTEEEDAQ